MLFANVCAGFIRSRYGEFWKWHFLVFLASLLCLVCLGDASFAGRPFAHKTWVTWCASCWTRLFGVVRRVHCLCNHWSVRQLIK